MARQRVTIDFEDIVGPPPEQPTPFLDARFGFLWTSLKAYDNTNLPFGQAPVETQSGTGFAYSGAGAQRSTMSRPFSEEFALKRLFLIDVGGDDAGESVAIRGFRDGQQMALQFASLDGGDAPQKIRLGRDFRDVDFVDFVWGNFGSASVTLDDIRVKVEVPEPLPTIVPPDVPLA